MRRHIDRRQTRPNASTRREMERLMLLLGASEAVRSVGSR